MTTYLLFILVQFYCIFRCPSIKIKPELKRNISNFVYGINYKYEGMLAHSFERLYVVTKFILPSIGDLDFLKLSYDNTCRCLDDRNICNAGTKKYLSDSLVFCKRLNQTLLTIRDKLNHTTTQHTHSGVSNKLNITTNA